LGDDKVNIIARNTGGKSFFRKKGGSDRGLSLASNGGGDTRMGGHVRGTC